MVEPMPGIVAFGWALIIAFAVVILGLAFVIIWTAWFFNRAGEKWWKALIPIYNTITLLQILELPLWMIILCFLPYISVGMGIFLIVKIVEWFGKHPKAVEPSKTVEAKEVEAVEEPAGEGKKFCGKCGNEVKAGEKFCTNCGQEIA